MGSTDQSVWADLTTAQNDDYYHKDIPLVRYHRAEIIMTTNPNGGDVEVWVLE